MKNHLEEFVNNNRDAFDMAKPKSTVWKGIEKKVPGRRKIFNLFTLRQLAASLLIIANVATIYILLGRKHAVTGPAFHAPVEQVSSEPGYEKELDQISRIVEIKQAKLKEIGTSNPVIYKTFTTALGQLQSAYKHLENELSGNPNKEQLLEAMIQNLSLQQELLNQQLLIYQKLKQRKNEKNTASI